MKNFYKILVLFLGLCLIPLCADAIKNIVSGDASNAGDKKVKTYSDNFPYLASTPINIHADGFSLVADSGSLLHDLDISVAFIPYKGGTPFPSDMENVTGVCEGVRLLPNGEHFSQTNPARITLSYNPERIPMGYEPNEIYTYYCDDASHWHRLHRVAVDTVAHTVTSLTTHFTDFANAVIKVPEMPESKAFVPSMMTDLPDPDPMKGVPMIAAPTPNNRGTAELTYPIELPKGRNGMQPNLDLHYSSANAGSNGILGPGWSINFPAITIDTRWGVPRYDANYESEQYLVNGEPVLFRNEDGTAENLPYQTNSFVERKKGNVRFHARDTKNQNLIIRHGTNPTNYYWVVTDRNGVSTYYGRKFNPERLSDYKIDENSVVRTKDKCIAYWAATASVDVYGNYILYDNYKTSSNCIIPNHIQYTGNYKQKVRPTYEIVISTWIRDDYFSTGRLGVLQTEEFIVNSIVVRYIQKDHDFANYFLTYTEPEEDNLYMSRLEAITKYSRGGGQSTTEFSYSNASSGHFSPSQDFVGISGKEISKSENKSWNLGGTATVGVGFDVITTMLSGGGNYDYSRGEGKCTSMLMDMNGDGLKDIVFEENDKVYYCRQRKQGDKYSFDNAKLIPGLSRLSHEVTETNTWGLQVSFGVDLSYTNPISTSVTDAYFADINADGLPDFIDGLKITTCNLTKEGDPSYEEVHPGQQITMHNSRSCRESTEDDNGITLDGEVDEHIECDLKEVLVKSWYIDRFYSNGPTFPHFESYENDIRVEKIEDVTSSYPEIHDINGNAVKFEKNTNRFYERPICGEDYNINFKDKSLIYRIEGDKVNAYRLEYVCDTTKIDPEIETVRVWVASKSGTYTIRNEIALQKDESKSRSHSLKADGVSYSVQHCKGVEVMDNGRLHANEYAILRKGTIDADDYSMHIWSDRVSVEAGDIIMFRLRSGENNRFDKTEWHQSFKECDSFGPTISGETITPGNLYFDSKKDFICTGDNFFRALYDGEICVTFPQFRNDGEIPVRVEVQIKSKVRKTGYAYVRDVNEKGAHPITDSVMKDDEVVIIMRQKNINPEPCWSDVHVSPCLQYTSNFKVSDNPEKIVHETVTYYPDVLIQGYSSIYPDTKSPYRQLFGPLHKGWGQFAYQNIGNQDIILLDSLVNTQQVAIEQVSSADFDTAAINQQINSFSPDENMEAQVNTVFAENKILNPVDSKNYWIPMKADCRTEQYIAYGNLGCIGKSIHSNAREITSPEIKKETVEETIEYDSPLPTKSGKRLTNFVFKESRSTQHSISWGAVCLNNSVSTGTYESLVDYMDMNGDGFPDVLGKGGIQYTRPWGSIDKLQMVSNYSPFKSVNNALGEAFSACPAQLEKITGNNIRDNKFSMSPSMGVTTNSGGTSTHITYIDVNADGLPDKVDVGNQKICYNLGYSFSDPYSYKDVYVNEGRSESAGANGSLAFSIGQVSISGGVGLSESSNEATDIMVDINGDGLPDKIRNGSVAYNKGNGKFDSWKNLNGIANLERNTTTSESLTVGVTGGFTILGAKVNIGVQSSPYSTSISYGEATLTDMNGDGLVDYVYKDKQGTIYVRYNQSGKANLLDTVTNPTGQQIKLDYTLSEPTSAHMSRQWNLSRVENLAPDHPMPEMRRNITEIEYREPYYDNFERTDYGYKYVTATENGEKVYRSVYEQSYLRNGELIADSIMDTLRNVYVSHKHETRYKSIDGNSENTCDDKNQIVDEDGYWTDYYYGKSEPQITTRYTIKYDKFHNIIEYVDYGDEATPDDDWWQEITYLPNIANNMISLPKTEKISGNGMSRSSSVNYSNLGEPAEISFQINNKDIATTYIRYDKFGNIVAIIAPEDEKGERNWSKFEYDSITYTYITSIDNPFHTVTKTEYDYKWGLPISVIDPAGNEIRYTYDARGRLSTVLAPNELAQKKTYTILYEYGKTSYGMVALKHAPSAKSREASLFDQYGKLMQKKHYAEVEGKDQRVVDKAEEWDKYGRPISSAFPFVAKKSETEYEPFGNAQTVVGTKYDFMDRPIAQTNADNKEKEITYGFENDADGVMRFATSVTDENGIVTTTLKSPQGWTTQQIAGDGSKTDFRYTAIGELMEVIDADGYFTFYEYDELGRLRCRGNYNDNKTLLNYDLAGNLISKQTYRLDRKNEEIQYNYNFGRLQDIHYPYHKDNDVHFDYDEAGRIAKRTDGTGSEEFSYDKLGNVARSLRRIIVPSERYTYVFKTNYEYDSFGRIRSITYPDGEIVKYDYTTGGLLKSVMGNNVYIEERLYDEQGRKTFQYNGNGTSTRYEYDPERQWLRGVYTESGNMGVVLQDLTYDYDNVGNITHISQYAPGLDEDFGGEYENTYDYDEQYRLVHSEGDGAYPYYFKSTFSPAGRMGNKTTLTDKWSSELLFGYDGSAHHPRTFFDPEHGGMDLYWDLNGNLAQMISKETNSARLHEWDEENRLRFVLGEKYAGYYGYDGNGERVYKLAGTSSIDQQNFGETNAWAAFDDAVLYPNPYMVVTKKGYTKHYYAGSERIATVIGAGGSGHPIDIDMPDAHEKAVRNEFYRNYNGVEDPFLHDKLLKDKESTQDIDGNSWGELDYQTEPLQLRDLAVKCKPYILENAIKEAASPGGKEDMVFFSHSDHLGSANWITDLYGILVQYIHYAPYGEMMANKNITDGLYEERYKFTGKERDGETGYDYFGARYFWSALGHWLSVDPLADENPGISPYAYCSWNPISRIDPDGRDWYESDGEIKWTDLKSQQAMNEAKIAGKYLGEAVVIFDGNKNECWGADNTLTGKDANPATATIYGVNGKDDIQTYRGMTTPQSDSYSTLNAGDYNMFYQDMATSVYGEKGARDHNPPIAPALTYRITKLDGNAVLDGTKKGAKTTMEAVFMHRTDWSGAANHSSKGCMIIDGRQWRSVEKQLKKSSNIFLRVNR